MRYAVIPIDKPGVPTFEISSILKGQLHYFTEGLVQHGGKADEFLFPLERTTQLLDEGVFYMTSPLDDQNRAEIEITEEQEDLLAWLVSNQIERVKVRPVEE